MTPNPTLIVSARAHAQISSYQDTCKVTYHLHEITCTLLYMHTEISSYMDRSKWINRNFLIWCRGQYFPLPLLSNRFQKLGSKSDHRTEISGPFARNDALAARPEVLHQISCFNANFMIYHRMFIGLTLSLFLTLHNELLT